MDSLYEFVLSIAPIGIIVYDRTMNIIMTNHKADTFVQRYGVPEEVKAVCRRILETPDYSRFKEDFPGEVSLSRTMEGSQSRWTFMLETDTEGGRVCVFIIEDSLSSRLDINRIRSRYRLTRRETDVLRRILDGLKNSEIASELVIGEQTVKDYLSSVYSKTGTANRVNLMKTLFISATSEGERGSEEGR